MTLRLLCALVTGAVLGAAGLSFGTRIHLLLALLIGIMTAFSALTVLCAALTFRLKTDIPSRQTTRGEPFAFSFFARQFAPIPCGRIELTLLLPDGEEKTLLLHLPPFRGRKYRQLLDCPHRGAYTVGLTRVTLIDIFGFIRISYKLRGKTIRLEVLPKQLDGHPLPFRPSENGNLFSRNPDETGSPADIRFWQEGDSLKRVHWKLSLRRQALIVRTFEESTGPDALLLMDLLMPFEDSAAIEDALTEQTLAQANAQVSVSRALRVHLVGLHPQVIPCANATDIANLRRALATCPFDSPYAFEQVLIECAGRGRETGDLVVVTANLTHSLADTLLRIARSGTNAHLIWVRCAENDEQGALFDRMRLSGFSAEQVKI